MCVTEYTVTFIERELYEMCVLQIIAFRNVRGSEGSCKRKLQDIINIPAQN